MSGILASGKFTPEERQKLISEGFQLMEVPGLPPDCAWLWKPQPPFQLYMPRKNVIIIDLKAPVEAPSRPAIEVDDRT